MQFLFVGGNANCGWVPSRRRTVASTQIFLACTEISEKALWQALPKVLQLLSAVKAVGMAKLSAMTAFILLSSVRSIRTDTGDSSFISVTGCAESLVIDFLTTLSHSYQLQHLTAREKVERTPTLSNTKRHSSHCETVYTYRNSTQNFKYERVLPLGVLLVAKKYSWGAGI